MTDITSDQTTTMVTVTPPDGAEMTFTLNVKQAMSHGTEMTFIMCAGEFMCQDCAYTGPSAVVAGIMGSCFGLQCCKGRAGVPFRLKQKMKWMDIGERQQQYSPRWYADTSLHCACVLCA